MYWVAQTFLTFLLFLAFGTILPSADVVLNAQPQQYEILVTGRVTSADDGRPLENVRVLFYDATFPIEYQLEAVTDADGRYTVTDTILTSWAIQFQPTTESHRSEYYDDVYEQAAYKVYTTVPGLVLSGIDASLAPVGQSQVTGRVTAEQGGAPLQGVAVTIYDTSGKLLYEPVYTNSNGEYTFTQVALGEIKLYYDGELAGKYYLAEYYSNKTTVADADPVVVDSALVQGLNVALGEGGAIEPSITSDWYGRPIQSADVEVYDSNGKFVRRGRSIFYQSDPLIANLPPGSYRLYIFDGADEHLSEYYKDSQSLEQAQPVTVKAGQTTNVSAQLALKDTETVVSVATAKEVPGAIIVAYAYDFAPHFTLDSGQYWQRLPSTPWTVISIWSDPYKPNRYSGSEVGMVARTGSEGGVRLLYSDADDVYVSDNLGQSWTRNEIGSCVERPTVEAFVSSPANPSQIYLYQTCTIHDPFGTMYYQWLWYSADGGDTWQDQYDTEGWPQVPGSQIIPSPVALGRLYMSGDNSWLYRDAGGDAWADKNFPVLTIVPDADNPDILHGWSKDAAPSLVGARSEDGGQHWENWPQQPCPTPFRLLGHPTESDVLMVRCQEGLYGSENGGDSWQQRTTTPGQRIAPDYGTPGRILWVMQDGKLAGSTNNGRSWQILAVQVPLYLPSIVTDEQD